MALLAYLRDVFLDDELGIIFAANAFYGEQIRLHEKDVVVQAVKEAYSRACRDGAGDKTNAFDFLRLIEKACFESEASSQNIAGKSLQGVGEHCAEDIVTILPSWLLMKASKKDKRRFQMNTLQAPTAYPIDWVDRLAPNERYFILEPGEKIGGAWIWFTRLSSLRSLPLPRRGSKSTRADDLRDALGLIHRNPSGPTDPATYLCLYTLPAIFTNLRPHFRPTCIEAGSHSRFCAKANNTATPYNDPYGRTLNLRDLADHGNLTDGVPERVLRPIDSKLTDSANVIRFELLGPLTIYRGIYSSDNNSEYACKLRRALDSTALLSALM